MAFPSKSFHDEMADKMGAMHGDPSDDGDDGDDGAPDYEAGYKAAVGAFIDAVHSKDVDEAAAQLESAISLCSKKPAEEEPDGDEAGEGDDEHAGGGGHAALLLIPHGKGH